MRFLVDTQLPRDLTAWICAQGHDSIHVLDVGLAQAKDNPIWKFAEGENRIIVTKDEDFAEWIRRGRAGPSVLWLRIGNASNPALLEWLGPRWSDALLKLDAGERLVEVR